MKCLFVLALSVAMAAGQTNVIVVLRTQPDAELVRRVRLLHQPAIESALMDLKAAADAQLVDERALARAQSMADRLEIDAREAAGRAVERLCGAEQEAFVVRLRGLGATNIHRYRAVNAVAARIPDSALAKVARDQAVTKIQRDGILKGQLDVSAVALGVPAFWDVGITGAGQSIALIDSGVDAMHPALVGANIVHGPVFSSLWFFPHQDNPTSPDDHTLVGHGTKMAGILVGQGSPGYPRHWGVARGATLYNLKAAYNGIPYYGAVPNTMMTFSAMLAALDYAVLQTPAKIVNISYAQGANSSGESAGAASLVDEIIAAYDVAVVVGFPDAFDPAISNNTIAVGAMDDRNTIGRADDTPSPTPASPTYAGRKPDLAAPGVNILAPTNLWEGGLADYANVPGVSTLYPIGPSEAAVVRSPSAAAAHVSGALALLRQTGITDMLLAKAILINSAEGSGWTADRGFGYLNLWNAKARGSYFSKDLNPEWGARYFGGPVDSGALSLTFSRRHGHPSSGPNFLVYDRRSGAAVHTGNSGQIVEKVSLPNGHYLVQVYSDSRDWALAMSRRGFEPVSTASFTTACWGDRSVEHDSNYFVTCTVTNHGDLEHRVWGNAFEAASPDGAGTVQCVIDFGRVAGHTTRTQSCQLKVGAPGQKQACVQFWRNADYGYEPPLQPAKACYAITVRP